MRCLFYTLAFVCVWALISSPVLVLAQSTGPVAAYSFNEGSGSSVGDLSGNNLTGTIAGATWTTAGRYGYALSFNGTSSYVDIGNPAALQLTGSMTLEAWVYATSTPPDDGQIIAKSSGPGWQLKTTPDTGPHTFGAKAFGSTSAQRNSVTVRSLNTWYHVASVYDAAAGTLTVYVNGSPDNGILTGTVPFSQINQSVNVNIGRRTGGYYFSGTIDEVRIYNRALTQSEIQVDMATPLGGTPPPPDTTPPTISITSPASGATVSGTTNIVAAVADNVGIGGVQFLLDGVNLGNEITSAPFTFQWNTVSASVGTHTLSAIARDLSGNAATSAGVPVTVSNPTPAQVGQWSSLNSWPIVAVHAILLPSGDVLAWTDYSTNSGAQIWRPSTNTFVPKSYDPVSLFCAGHSFLADGRVFVVGGIVGLQDDLGPRESTIFNPATESWSAAGLMTTGRYYPTSTTLADGRVLVLGGTTTCSTCIADTPEIYDPATDRWTEMAPTARMSFKYYPHSYVLPDGRILVAGQDDKATFAQVLDLNTQRWTTIDPRILDGHSSVMYLPGKVMKAGTATADNPGLPSAATTYVLDMTQASPAWETTAPMAFPRSYLNLTLLPDGQVLATGGGTNTSKADYSAAVYAAEVWSPTTKAWTTMASMQAPRLYHSTALLLPDARVLVAGGGRQNGRSQPDPKDQANAEVFSPPYLFKGPRPVITSVPALINYNSPFTVATPDAPRIASASLLALSAVTHAFNENQRFVPLTFEQGPASLNVHAPVDGRIAPPGPYMLFIVDNNGVPSVAAMTRLPAPSEDTQAPSAPTGLAATGAIGTANLSWNASTDNVAVTAYNVHRSTTSGFVPNSANKITQTVSTNFADTSFATAGTYYYVVTAQDANANVSAPSNQATALIALDSVSPVVSITSPTSGATVSGSVTISANATDNVSVAGVQFLLDGSALGAEVTGSGPTYSINWATTSASNGTHTISARARDGAGNTALAVAVNAVVSNALPSGLVAAYSFNEGSGSNLNDVSGNNIRGTIVGASWTPSGKHGSALSFNGTTNYVDLGNPTALQLTGSMTVEAWIKAAANPADDGQIVAKSNGTGWQLKTTPDTGPHTFGIAVSPSSGPSTQRYSTTVRSLGTWYHIAGVYDATTRTLSTYVNGVLDNGVLLGTVPNNQLNQAVNVNIGRRTGGYYFNGLIDEVRIYNRALSASEIQIDMNTPVGANPPPPDTTAPSVSIVSPSAGANVTGSIVLVASASDNIGVAGVQFLLDGTNLASELTGAGPTYSLNWNTATASNGTHTLSARARDAAGNLGSATSVSVSVNNADTTPPSVVVTGPSANSTVTGITTLSANATDNVAMAGLQFLLDGAPLGAEIVGTGPNYPLNWDSSTAVNGPHAISALARDTANNTAGAANVSFIVSNGDVTPPIVSVTAPTAGTSVSGLVIVTASASDNVGVAGLQFLLDGANLGAEILSPGPAFSLSWNTTTVTNGSHILSARARDGVGNVALATDVGVTVSNVAPAGLAVAYSMNQGSGTTTADSSGNNVTGSLAGATWTSAGKFGNALSFNGASGYVDLGNPAVLQSTGSMTWAAWVYAAANPADDGQIISKSTDAAGWQLKTSPDLGPHTFAVKVTGTSGAAYRHSATARLLNTWYHVAGVYNASTRALDIYVNGVLANGTLRGTVPAAQTLGATNVNIGRRASGYYFNGVLDEIQVYNRALSQSEIQSIMNSPLP